MRLKMEEEGKSLAETPTWAVATVITAMVLLGWLFLASLELFDKVLIISHHSNFIPSFHTYNVCL